MQTCIFFSREGEGLLDRVFAEVTAVAVGGETRGGRSGKALIGVSADGVTRTSCLHTELIICLEICNYYTHNTALKLFASFWLGHIGLSIHVNLHQFSYISFILGCYILHYIISFVVQNCVHAESWSRGKRDLAELLISYVLR